MTAFPDVDPAAISTLASSLKSISDSMAGVGLDTEAVRGSVMGSEQWKGTASDQWYTVVTGRVDDASLTNEVMGSAASLLDGLAQDLESEQRLYQRMSAELYTAKPQQGVMSRLDGPEMVLNPGVQKSMNTCAARAEQLLDDAARKLLAYTLLAEDIKAIPVADRTPGVLAGANRQMASLHLLAILFGSVRDNHDAGTAWEDAILASLGITKNNETWRPDPPLEGKMTKSGSLARGTIPEGDGSNFLLEVKGTKALNNRFQIRAEYEYAIQTNRPLWILKQGPGKADQSVVKMAEETGGGVVYTTDDGKTYTDGNGNLVKFSYDKASDTLKVTGYKPSAGGGSSVGLQSGGGSPDPGGPSEPVSPATADGTAGTSAGSSAVAPEDPGDPVDPVDPEIP